KKREKYENDDNTAQYFIMTLLDEEDQRQADECDPALEVWKFAVARYVKTSESIARRYVMLQNFALKGSAGIDSSWAKLLDYRRKVVEA
ncbi:hypothetical protein BJ878DRAFT_392371, partial [Calycina marina]